MKNIIFIVEGISRIRGGTNTEFIGAATDREQAFKISLEQSKREFFETFKICQYNLKTNKYEGFSETIFPYQEYTSDGHLAPLEKRVNEKCTQGIWGPYCQACRELFNQELSLALKNKKEIL